MTTDYTLDGQIGYVLRRANQRHQSIFSDLVPQVTYTQFAILARLAEFGPQSQNQLGRSTALDRATVKGVVGRLVKRELVATMADPDDRRRLTVSLTAGGDALLAQLREKSLEVNNRTLGPLSDAEVGQLMMLLQRLT